ncbi:hypothetical protein GJ496_002988 [Pomphorhynchus laevis]|nr:hypothetical protein GJ496_002988 [Pomphorhynchus laevis]
MPTCKDRSTWTFCEACNHHICSQYCSHDNPDVYVKKSDGFFRAKLIFTELSKCKSAALDLHPSVLKILDMRIGDIVIVDQFSVAFTVHTSSAVKPDVVSIAPILPRNLKFLQFRKPGKDAIINERKYSIARCSSPLNNTFLAQKYINRIIRNCVYINADSRLEVEFLGKVLTLSFNQYKKTVDDDNEQEVENAFRALSLTDIYFKSSMWYLSTSLKDKIHYMHDKVFNLDQHINTLSKWLIDPLMNGDHHRSRSILLYGPSGCGKSILCDIVKNSLQPLPIRCIRNSGNNFSMDSDDKNILVIIDPISSSINETSLSSLKNCFDNHQCVLATCDSKYNIDPCLRRFNRFSVEIELQLPNADQRIDVVRTLLANNEISTEIANVTRSFSYADLTGLVDKVKQCASLYPTIERMFLSLAQKERPSVIKHIPCEIPDVKWDDIGGMRDAKQQLIEVVMWPFIHTATLSRMSVKTPKGILLYGPPGCSKTLICKALASEGKLNFLSIKGPELFSKWVGESERAVREIFSKARSARPCIIFFDEIDSIGSCRGSDSGVADRVLTQLLTEMDGIDSDVRSAVNNENPIIIIAATNRPNVIDPALLRPGRFDRLIYIPLPDIRTRAEILRIHLASIKLEEEKQIIIDRLASATEGYSGAELVAVCQEAALSALRENIKCDAVKWIHFTRTLTEHVFPRTDPELIKSYEQFNK